MPFPAPSDSLPSQHLPTHLALCISLRKWVLFFFAATSPNLVFLDVAYGDESFGISPTTIDFQTDVMSVLSKAGCNLGICHGNKYGKGGFKLSLRGEDPASDYLALTRELSGRRINTVAPEESLLLRKPLMEVPHEGGRRFRKEDPEHRILTAWLAAGAPLGTAGDRRIVELIVEPAEAVITEPATTQQIRARVRFSDDTERDVTRMAVYETSLPIVDIDRSGLVTRTKRGETNVIVRYLDQQVPVRLAFIGQRPQTENPPTTTEHPIDRIVFSRLQALGINAAPITSDLVYLRRAYLDITGTLPSPAVSRAFAADQSDSKRSTLIDQLLSTPEYSLYWAQKWSDLLRNEERTLDRKGVQNFHSWIRRSLDDDMPLDQMAQQILAARGSTYQQPETNYYRALRDPIERAETTAQLFLGIRLQCAKCHSHPFDRWTQDDYYQWVALFSRVDYRILENRRQDNNDSHEFDGEQLVIHASKGEFNDPRTNKPASPKFLGGDRVASTEDRLDAVAAWVGNSQNQRFIDTQVNRIWFHLMGRGIVDPIDDFRVTNPPSHPELLTALREFFIQNGCRTRPLIRWICQSQVYQLAVDADDTNRDDELHFARGRPRQLAAEVLLDAMSQATETPLKFAGYPQGIRAGEIPGVRGIRDRDRSMTSHDTFLKHFGKPPRQQSCECERSGEPTFAHALHLVTGDTVTSMLTQPSNRLGRLLNEGCSSEQILEEIFWSTLQRSPNQSEREGALRHIAEAKVLRSAWEDVFWAVLNTREFLTRR